MFDDFKRMTRDFSSAERRALFHDNAARFYRLYRRERSGIASGRTSS
jgi:hypothetical protein